MKKLFMALAAALVLTGCSTSTETPDANTDTPAETTGTTLDAASFAEQLSQTDAADVRVYVTTEASRETAAVDMKADTEGMMETITGIVEGVNAETAASQEKVYGNPYYFIELNGPLDDNFMRFVVYGDGTLAISNKDSFTNYTLSSDSFDSVSEAFESMAPTEVVDEETAE